MSTIENAFNKLKKSDSAESSNLDEQKKQQDYRKRIEEEYSDELNPSEFWDEPERNANKKDNSNLGSRQSQADSDNKSSTSVSSQTIDLRKLESKNIITSSREDNSLVEEFRVIKRPILNNAFGAASKEVDNSNIIMVTSALPEEGKTFTSINLAMSMATEMDTTVLLIDADIPKPSVSEYLGLDPNLPGLIDLLVDDKIKMADVLVKTNVENLVILPAGSGHEKATEILASSAMLSLIGEISQRYNDRAVILDSPPLLITSEAKVLADIVGQVVLVVESYSTSHENVKKAVDLLDDNDIVNLVLNKSRTRNTNPYYGSSYRRHYK